ncbi:MAG: hypothetical protein R3F59_29055 [Myxococcota bacterium]
MEAVRRDHAGKKSPLKAALRGLRDLAPEARAEAAREINEAAAAVEAELQAASERLEGEALQARIAEEWQDLSMPGLLPPRGSRHPISLAEARSMDALRRLGFEVEEGPEVDHPFYNFDALNIPEHHPARDMQDTFWVDGGWLLRSHHHGAGAPAAGVGPRRPSRSPRSAASTGTKPSTPRTPRCSTSSRASGSTAG